MAQRSELDLARCLAEQVLARNDATRLLEETTEQINRARRRPS